MSQIKVKPGDVPLPTEVLETAIVDLASAMHKLSASRLKREVIVTLLHDNSKIAKGTIRIILNNLDQLEALFLKPKAKP